jgi:hypothetical protein
LSEARTIGWNALVRRLWKKRAATVPGCGSVNSDAGK